MKRVDALLESYEQGWRLLVEARDSGHAFCCAPNHARELYRIAEELEDALSEVEGIIVSVERPSFQA